MKSINILKKFLLISKENLLLAFLDIDLLNLRKIWIEIFLH